MLPRHASDYRTMLWAFVLTPGVVAFQYARPDLVPYLFWVSCYFALACGVIAHNHNHTPTFHAKWMNELFGNWLSFFYGYPTFAWIPTHNLNHHRYVNRPGDATITWRFTNGHNALVAATYFFVSSYYQSGPINEFIANAKAKNPRLYRRVMSQYFIFGTFQVVMAGLAIFLHGIGTGLYVYGLTVLLPGFFALWTIMLFNYCQHVHADPWSKTNHSRSWEGPVLNFLLFNNGYHAAHHENAGAHWSELKSIHLRIRDRIDPSLIEGNLWWYFFRQFFLAAIIPSFGSKQLGRAGFEPPQGETSDSATAEVGLGEEGTNADMLDAIKA